MWQVLHGRKRSSQNFRELYVIITYKEAEVSKGRDRGLTERETWVERSSFSLREREETVHVNGEITINVY